MPAPPNLDVDGNMQDDLASSSPQAPEPANEDATRLQAGAVNAVRAGGGLSISGVGPPFVTAVAASAAEERSTVQVGTMRKRDWESKHTNDIIGVVVLAVEGVDDLPEWPNGTLFRADFFFLGRVESPFFWFVVLHITATSVCAFPT